MTDPEDAIHVDLRPQGEAPPASAGGGLGDWLRLSAPSGLFSEPLVHPRLVLTLRILNPLMFIVVCVANGLGASGAIGNGSQGELSDKYPTPITPAGYAFSIWSLIYLFQAVLFLVYQFLPCVNKGLVFRRIGFLHIVLCVLNIGWIFAFSYEQMVLQCVIICGMLATLLTIYARIHTHGSFCTNHVRQNRTWLEYFCVYVPWSLYASWLVGATLISLFIAAGCTVPEESVNAGLAALSFAAFANLMVLAWSRDVWFAGVNVWTLIAIFFNQSYLPVIWSSAISLAGVVGACAAVVWGTNVLALLPPMGWSSASSKGSLHDGMLADN